MREARGVLPRDHHLLSIVILFGWLVDPLSVGLFLSLDVCEKRGRGYSHCL